MILALAGGVGGAKLANGLAAVLPPGSLTVAVNIADDFEHLGLTICPDIDTVTYTLAGINDTKQGWGLEQESWAFLDSLATLGGETWFRLGDRDLATHVQRMLRLRAGDTLSAITTDFATRLGIAQAIVPISDDPVRSFVMTDEGELPFQDYFVRRRCEPRFVAIRYDGAESARPSPALRKALDDPGLQAIIICPSNPMLSIDPILAVPEIGARIRARSVPCVAVSPFIGGQAVKGPAAKIMAELGLASTPAAVAAHYAGVIDGLVIDTADSAADNRPALPLHATDILMRDTDDQRRLAGEVLSFALGLAG